MKPCSRIVAVTAIVASAGCGALARAAYDQSFLVAEHNWAFRDRFPRGDRLLNAFDYGHAVLYQTLLVQRNAAPDLEGRQFDFITRDLLRRPPALPLDESAIAPDFAKLAPEVLAVFDWAHLLHRQLYDALAVSESTDAARDAAVARLVVYYRSRPDVALSTRPKSMALMEAQPYSLAFRRQDPKFNGLLWSYHWFQLALYDALLQGRTQRERQAGVDSVADRFFRLLDDAPSRMPAEMPMAPGASPLFAARYPDAAIVFDNLHALHDVVSDILVSPAVPAAAKRTALLAAAAAYRDDTTAVTTTEEWRQMGRTMGVPTPPVCLVSGSGGRELPTRSARAQWTWR